MLRSKRLTTLSLAKLVFGANKPEDVTIPEEWLFSNQ
jgi:hypothetical protein